MTPQEFRDVVDYDPETGKMTWRERPVHMFNGPNPKVAAGVWNKRFSGTEAFSSPNGRGYHTGVLFGVRMAAHRAAWFHFYGIMPNGPLDHINGITTDNRIDNLREATATQNQYNRKAKTESLYATKRGAQFHKRNKKWTASIRVHLGYFDTEEEAAAAYEAAAKELHGRFYLPNGLRQDS